MVSQKCLLASTGFRLRLFIAIKSLFGISLRQCHANLTKPIWKYSYNHSKKAIQRLIAVRIKPAIFHTLKFTTGVTLSKSKDVVKRYHYNGNGLE